MVTWILVIDVGISLVSILVATVYIALQYHEYKDARSDLLRECAEAVVCEAFQRFMQPTIALRFECLTREQADASFCVQEKQDIVKAIDTQKNLTCALQMTPEDVQEMVATAEIIWQDEDYEPYCKSQGLRHELLVSAAHRLHGAHVEQLLQHASTFVQAAVFRPHSKSFIHSGCHNAHQDIND